MVLAAIIRVFAEVAILKTALEIKTPVRVTTLVILANILSS